MEKVECAWEEERGPLMEFVVSMELVVSKHNLDADCMICFSKKAVISCKDCKKQQLCEVCDQSVHIDDPLHNRKSYANCIQPIAPTEVLNESYEIIPADIYRF